MARINNQVTLDNVWINQSTSNRHNDWFQWSDMRDLESNIRYKITLKENSIFYRRADIPYDQVVTEKKPIDLKRFL
jgi:hypothetical protein